MSQVPARIIGIELHTRVDGDEPESNQAALLAGSRSAPGFGQVRQNAQIVLRRKEHDSRGRSASSNRGRSGLPPKLADPRLGLRVRFKVPEYPSSTIANRIHDYPARDLRAADRRRVTVLSATCPLMISHA